MRTPQLPALHQPLNLLCMSSSYFISIMSHVILLLLLSTVTKSQFIVKTLPGILGDIPFTLETGYVGVGKADQVQLFYYFIESEGNPIDDPLILWLTGGPGCSGLSGLVFEIGPFTFNYLNSGREKPALELNPYSWTKVANIIFLDQPVGTGYSYAKTLEAYNMSDALSAIHTYHFLRKWLVDHPKFLDNPLYIGGDSYSGIVLPIIVQEIYNGNEVGNDPWMNIKGYMLGNPLTDRNGDYNSKLSFAHRMALLSDKIYESAKENCHGEFLDVDLDNILCVNDLQVVDGCLHRIRNAHILEPWCDMPNALKSNLLASDLGSFEQDSIHRLSLPLRQGTHCRDYNYLYVNTWANSKDVQEALHVHQETMNKKWVRCNSSMTYHYGDKKSVSYTFDIPSSVDYHRSLTNKNCKVIIYSGDHDMVVPHVGTKEWIESLALPVETDWQPWFLEGQIAGYYMKFSKKDYEMTFATVKGAGHTAPEYKPEQCLAMVRRWFDNVPL